MNRVPVKSSAIRSVGYNPDSMLLEVEYSSGIIYQYFGVPAETHKTIMEADSIGKAFNSVRGAFAFKALTLEEQEEQELGNESTFVEGDNAE